MGHFQQPGSEQHGSWGHMQTLLATQRKGDRNNRRVPGRIKLSKFIISLSLFLSLWLHKTLFSLPVHKQYIFLIFPPRTNKRKMSNSYLNKPVEIPVDSKSPSNRQTSFKSSWKRCKSSENALCLLSISSISQLLLRSR